LKPVDRRKPPAIDACRKPAVDAHPLSLIRAGQLGLAFDRVCAGVSNRRLAAGWHQRRAGRVL